MAAIKEFNMADLEITLNLHWSEEQECLKAFNNSYSALMGSCPITPKIRLDFAKNAYYGLISIEVSDDAMVIVYKENIEGDNIWKSDSYVKNMLRYLKCLDCKNHLLSMENVSSRLSWQISGSLLNVYHEGQNYEVKNVFHCCETTPFHKKDETVEMSLNRVILEACKKSQQKERGFCEK